MILGLRSMSRATCDETASLVSAACVSESTTAADTDGTPCDGPCGLQYKRDRVLCVGAQAAIGEAPQPGRSWQAGGGKSGENMYC